MHALLFYNLQNFYQIFTDYWLIFFNRYLLITYYLYSAIQDTKIIQGKKLGRYVYKQLNMVQIYKSEHYEF